MKKLLALFSVSICLYSSLCLSVYSQQQKPAPSKPVVVITESNQTTTRTTPETKEGRQQPITNADIIRMVKAGFGESIIINHIQTNESRFDVSINALFELKNNGVSQKLIETMQFVAAATAAAGGVRQPAQKVSNQPLPQQQQQPPPPDNRSASATAVTAPPVPTSGLQFYALLVQGGDKQLLLTAPTQLVQTKEKTGDLASIAKDEAVTAAISAATTGAATAAGAATIGSSIPVVGGIIAGGVMAGNLFRKKPTATYVLAIGGQNSRVVPQTDSPKFEVVFGNIAGVDPDEYEPAIVKLIPTMNNWRLVYARKAKQGYPVMEGKFYSGFTEEKVASRSVRLGRGDIQIEAEKPLEAGEFAVVLRPVSQAKTYSMKNIGDVAALPLVRAVWDFSIKTFSGNAQNPGSSQNPITAQNQASVQKTTSPPSSQIADVTAANIQTRSANQNSRKTQAENMQASITSRSSSGVTINLSGSYDRAFETVLNFLKKQGNTIDAAAKETGQITTAITISGGYRQTGSRVQITFIKEGENSVTMRVAVVEQKRYKALKTEPWGDPKVSLEKSNKAADELLAMLAVHF